MKRKKLLVSAAGTATAWNIIATVNRKFPEDIIVMACDINPSHLVASSTQVSAYSQVPRIDAPDYYVHMLDLMRRNDIDIYVPLIDMDMEHFFRNNPDLERMGVLSTAPASGTVRVAVDKRNLFLFLEKKGFPVPRSIPLSAVQQDEYYFVKPARGFGSRGAGTMSGGSIREIADPASVIIQQVCSPPEVTVEVYRHGKNTRAVVRERIEIKAGVCTKARFYDDEHLQSVIRELVQSLDFPEASCIQFMKETGSGRWLITDVNLRLGAGTAMSTAVGWDLTSAALATWAGLACDPLEFLKPLHTERYVVRVYQEVVTI